MCVRVRVCACVCVCACTIALPRDLCLYHLYMCILLHYLTSIFYFIVQHYKLSISKTFQLFPVSCVFLIMYIIM